MPQGDPRRRVRSVPLRNPVSFRHPTKTPPGTFRALQLTPANVKTRGVSPLRNPVSFRHPTKPHRRHSGNFNSLPQTSRQEECPAPKPGFFPPSNQNPTGDIPGTSTHSRKRQDKRSVPLRNPVSFRHPTKPHRRHSGTSTHSRKRQDKRSVPSNQVYSQSPFRLSVTSTLYFRRRNRPRTPSPVPSRVRVIGSGTPAASGPTNPALSNRTWYLFISGLIAPGRMNSSRNQSQPHPDIAAGVVGATPVTENCVHEDEERVDTE